MTNKMEIIRNEIEQLDVDVVHKIEDKYAAFPYITTVTWSNAVVYEHDLISDETHVALSESTAVPEIDSAFIAISVAASVIRKKVQKSGINAIEDLYRPLASSDGLSRKIYDEIETGRINQKDGEFLLRAIKEGDLRPDVAGINGCRLAANVAIRNTDIKNGLMHDAKEAVVGNLESDKKRYEHALNLFGRNSPIQASQMVANSLSTAYLALAFPMEDEESAHYFDMLDV